MPDITVEQLASALESFRLDILSHGVRVSGEVADPDEVAEALHATLGRMAALREGAPHPDPELAAIGAIMAALAALDDAAPNQHR